MQNTTPEVKDFPSWAKEIYNQYPDVLEHMRKSSDVLDRVIAKRIMQIAEV